MLNDLLELFLAELVQELFVEDGHVRRILTLFLTLVVLLLFPLFTHLLLVLLLVHHLLLLHGKQLFLLFRSQLV